MKNVSDKRCRENRNNTFYVQKLVFENRAVYEMMWENVVKRGRQQVTIRCMRIACWLPTATNTHPDYVIHISFPQQQRLNERATM
jgi:hypothetical protein